MAPTRPLALLAAALLTAACDTTAVDPDDSDTGTADSSDTEDSADTADTGETDDSDTPDASLYVGNWSGTWTLLVGGSDSGAASLSITRDTAQSQVTAVLDLDGDVFGDIDPAAVSMTGPYAAAGFEVSANDTDAYGEIAISFSADGTITGTSKPVLSSDILTFSGSATATEMTVDYAFEDTDGSVSASGRLDLDKD